MIDKECEMCVMLERVFPGRFDGCAELSHKMAFDMVKEMMAKMAKLATEVEGKFKAGEISEEERKKLLVLCEKSVVFCAASIPGCALFLRAKTDPIEMMELVAKEAARVTSIVLNDKNALNDLFNLIEQTENAPPIDPSKMN